MDARPRLTPLKGRTSAFAALLVALSLTLPAWDGHAQSLPPDLARQIEEAAIEGLTNQANYGNRMDPRRRGVNRWLEAAVVQAIVARPDLVSPIVAHAIQVAPESRGYLVAFVAEHFPAFSHTIRVSAGGSAVVGVARHGVPTAAPIAGVPEFEWTARVNVGASKSSGNTDNEAYNIDAEAQGRGEKDRITLLAEFNRESSQGDETADDQRLAGQYDRFISKTWFVYLQGSAERDDFQDLNLRTTIGPGIGYQVIDTELAHLSVEAGPTYVNEDFDLAEDRDFITARWALKFDTFVYEKFAQLFHNQEGLVDLEDTSGVLIRTRQGARIPLRNNLNVAAQVNLDHDTEPAPGRDKTDTKYILSVGYNF